MKPIPAALLLAVAALPVAFAQPANPAAPGSAPAPALSPSPGLSLDDCLRLAADRQPALAAAEAGAAAATEAVGEARAPYYPQVDLNAGYHRWQRRAFLPSGLTLPGKPVPGQIGPLDDWTGGLSSRVTLYDAGERRAGLEAAVARRAAAVADATATQADVRLAVQAAFYALAAAADMEAVAQTNLERTRRHLHLAEIRRQSGAVPQVDVLRMQAEVAAAELQLIGVRSNRRIAAGRLNTAMGRPAETALAITPPAAVPPPVDTADLAAGMARALAHRAELQSAEKRAA